MRNKFPDLEMSTAPGFDSLMPHDMCHLIVEQELQIKQGIFGQLAVGGTGGSFGVPPNESVNGKNDSRHRRRTKQKGEKLAKENLDDLAKSERATYVCWHDWISHSPDKKIKKKTEEMYGNAISIFSQMSDSERAIYTEENFAKVRRRMDELSNQWKKLKIQETMIVNW